LIDAG